MGDNELSVRHVEFLVYIHKFSSKQTEICRQVATEVRSELKVDI